jgi:pilus assembly protein CpaE
MVLRVFLAGRNPQFGEELRQLLDTMSQVQVLDCVRDPAAAISSIGREKPDVVMVEIPEGEGASEALDGIGEMLGVAPGASIVAVGPGNSAEVVIRAVRAGAIEFLERPVSPRDLMAAMEKIRRLRPAAAAGAGQIGKIVSVYATKGGLGATTLATNLAVCLAQQVGRTVLVDLDVHQGSVATFLNLRPRYSVVDMFAQTHRLDEAYLSGLLLRHSTGLHVLPAVPSVGQPQFTPEQMLTGLEALRSQFAHVVLDLPRDASPATFTVLEQSDLVLYLVGLNVPALRASAMGLATLRGMGIDERKVKIVVARADARDEVSVKQAGEALGMPVFWRAQNDYPTVVSSINEGTPFVLSYPRSEVAKNMQALGRVVANGGGKNGNEKDRPSLLRRVLTFAA